MDLMEPFLGIRQVLEGQNILVTISGKKNRVRVYYLSWLKNKILKSESVSDGSVGRVSGSCCPSDRSLHGRSVALYGWF